jgi:hypothetical protein
LRRILISEKNAVNFFIIKFDSEKNKIKGCDIFIILLNLRMSFTFSKKQLFTYLDNIIHCDPHQQYSTGIIINEKITPFINDWCEDFNKKNIAFKVKISSLQTLDYNLSIKFCGFKRTTTKNETVELKFNVYKKQVTDFEETERCYNHDNDPQIILNLFTPIK